VGPFRDSELSLPSNISESVIKLTLWKSSGSASLSKSIRVRVRVTLRLSVYRKSVCLGDKPLLILTTSNFISQLNTCGYSPYVTSSLTRGRVCRLQLLLVLASPVILRSESRRTVSDSRLPQPGGPGLRIYIPQEQGGPVIHSGHGFPFRRLLRLAGLQWRYSTPPPHGMNSQYLPSPLSSVDCYMFRLLGADCKGMSSP
jgi:hypothetical protein